MTDYLLLVREDEAAHAAQSPTAIAELITSRARFADELRRAGRLKDHGRFRPSREGKRVRIDDRPFADDGKVGAATRIDVRGTSVRVDDGPFADDGKALAAYYWIDAPDVDEASRVAAEVPTLPSDEIDVRPLMKGAADADMQAKPGKIFAFAVLGTAASEQAWSDVMDRIDDETHDRFPADSFLGGNRLQPPRAGKRVASSGERVATRGERRAMFDGPFLESKEVIGGVFFLRMMSIDDAVQWAAASRFVVHGALEIRELWRS